MHFDVLYRHGQQKLAIHHCKCISPIFGPVENLSQITLHFTWNVFYVGHDVPPLASNTGRFKRAGFSLLEQGQYETPLSNL